MAITTRYIHTVGLIGLLSAVSSGFLFDSHGHVDPAEEWSAWIVAQSQPYCLQVRGRNCSTDGCIKEEFKLCDGQVDPPEEWSGWTVAQTQPYCLQIRRRNCSTDGCKRQEFKLCDATSTPGHETRTWGDWSAWECHKVDIGCMLYRSRQCLTQQHDCTGSRYELKSCGSDSCTENTATSTSPSIQIVAWNNWGAWECHPEQHPCVLYRFRQCSSDNDDDCKAIGGLNYNIKVCNGQCSNGITVSTPSVTTHVAEIFASTGSPNTGNGVHVSTIGTGVGTTTEMLPMAHISSGTTSGIVDVVTTYNPASITGTGPSNLLSTGPTASPIGITVSSPSVTTPIAETFASTGSANTGNGVHVSTIGTGVGTTTEMLPMAHISSVTTSGIVGVVTTYNHANITGTGSSNLLSKGPTASPIEWSRWFYDKCSVTCGNGTTMRLRHCSSGKDSDCGTGKAFETVACQENPCPVDGFWSGWVEWSKCSTTCSDGIRKRSRACDNPAPVNGGAFCVGAAEDTVVCNFQDCSQWSRWFYDQCSVTCGSGITLRVRHCGSGKDSDCGTGNAIEAVTCTEKPCLGPF